MWNQRPFLFLSAGAVIAISSFLIFNVSLKSVELPVPFYHQEHNLSCEAASLRMLLAGFSIKISEDEIIKQMNFDLTPKSIDIWGDPERGFVGNVDGEPGKNGYGIYPEALKPLGQRWLPVVIEKRNWTLVDLKMSLNAGVPLILWGVDAKPDPMQWHTVSGKLIIADRGEHTRVLYGYKDYLFHRTRYFLMDPLKGRIDWSEKDLIDNWRAMQFMAIGFRRNR